MLTDNGPTDDDLAAYTDDRDSPVTAHPIDTEEARFGAEAHLRYGGGGDDLAENVLALLDALATAAGRAIRAEAQSEARRIDIAYWTARAQMMGRKRDAGLRDLAHVQKERDNALARIKAVEDVLDSIDTSTEPALHDGFADIRRALDGTDHPPSA